MSAVVSADTCPLCWGVHGQTDPLWSCPEHGHRLGNPRDDGDWLAHRCPVRTCRYERSAPRPPRSSPRRDELTTAITRPSAAVDIMYSRAEQLRALLPPTVDVGSFMGSAQAALFENAKLLEAAEASPDSLMIALTECARLGHIPGSKEYYLTPRKDHGRPKVLGVEGYRGVIQRILNGGRAENVIVREVCAKDRFRFVEGSDEIPAHSFGDSGMAGGSGADFFGASGSLDRGEMVGVYAYAKLTGGGYSRVTLLSREDVHAARATGGWKPDDSYSPWNRLDGGPDHPEFTGRSMWWKTAAKRLEPWVTTSPEDLRQPQREAIAAVQVSAAPIAPLESPRRTPPAVAGNGRQALPAGRQKPAQRRSQNSQKAQPPSGDVVVKALRTAIGNRLGEIGIAEGDERDNYIHRLAGKERGADLAPDDLRGVLADLAELGETPTVEDLQKLCASIEGDDTEYLAELAGEAS